MGSRVPKPFLKLNGITILEHTIRSFARVDCVAELIVATSADWFKEVEEILEKYRDQAERVLVVEGGAERQHSIYNALQVVSPNTELVAVHDAVRPFMSARLIEACADRASEAGGAIIAVPAKDTIKRVNSVNEITETPDRRELWQAQTPQIFQRQLLVSAYEKARQDNFVGTDDASLVERTGRKVEVVEGDRRNLKITYPIDLKVAELILNEGQV